MLSVGPFPRLPGSPIISYQRAQHAHTITHGYTIHSLPLFIPRVPGLREDASPPPPPPPSPRVFAGVGR